MFSDGTIWPKGKTIRYNITKNIAIQYGMHKRNIKLNALQHGRQFVKERLLLWQRMRAWSVQQDDVSQWNSQHGHVLRRSQTWSTDRQCRSATTRCRHRRQWRRRHGWPTGRQLNADTHDRRCKRRRISNKEQRCQHRARVSVRQSRSTVRWWPVILIYNSIATLLTSHKQLQMSTIFRDVVSVSTSQSRDGLET